MLQFTDHFEHFILQGDFKYCFSLDLMKPSMKNTGVIHVLYFSEVLVEEFIFFSRLEITSKMESVH